MPEETVSTNFLDQVVGQLTLPKLVLSHIGFSARRRGMIEEIVLPYSDD